ncbi:MAG: oxidoreductase [Pirellulaceae bacterium]|nr:oxidoreductase [Pirellulaceae bacterium]
MNNILQLPWLELAILIPLAGTLTVMFVRDPETARRRVLIVCGLMFACAVGAWLDFGQLHTFEAHDHWDLVTPWLGEDAVVIDELSAPLMPLAALLYLLTAVATLRTKMGRFPFTWTLFSAAILMATLSCRAPWGVIGLLALQTVPPYFELRERGRSTRVFVLHMGLFLALLAGGWALLQSSEPGSPRSIWAIGMLTAAILIRSGSVPLHCWMTDLFENASFATALLYVTPMAGAYAAVRLLLPVSPEWAMRSIAIISLVTAVYAAGMALVQREARRFFAYLFLSNSSLVLVGLEVATPIGLTGGLCVWLSVGMSLAGFGLTLRSLESRTGRISLDTYHGLASHMPSLAAFFLLTGLASVGFPGTVGFVGVELLVEGAVGVYPLVGMLVVVAAALNGIAVLHAYFRLFTGAEHRASITLQARWPERVAVLTLSALILGGGLFPQPGVHSRYHAATELIARNPHAPAPRVHAGYREPDAPVGQMVPSSASRLAERVVTAPPAPGSPSGR